MKVDLLPLCISLAISCYKKIYVQHFMISGSIRYFGRGTDPPPWDWCRGLLPPQDPLKLGNFLKSSHKNAIKLKNRAPPLKFFKNKPPPLLSSDPI